MLRVPFTKRDTMIFFDDDQPYSKTPRDAVLGGILKGGVTRLGGTVPKWNTLRRMAQLVARYFVTLR